MNGKWHLPACTELLFLLEKNSEYYPAKIKDTDIHIMNKYSLERCTNV